MVSAMFSVTVTVSIAKVLHDYDLFEPLFCDLESGAQFIVAEFVNLIFS